LRIVISSSLTLFCILLYLNLNLHKPNIPINNPILKTSAKSPHSQFTNFNLIPSTASRTTRTFHLPSQNVSPQPPSRLLLHHPNNHHPPTSNLRSPPNQHDSPPPTPTSALFPDLCIPRAHLLDSPYLSICGSKPLKRMRILHLHHLPRHHQLHNICYAPWPTVVFAVE
jgi:hypothetical protein